MIYIDELPYKEVKGGMEVILKNCAWDYNHGYRQLKIKIGRGFKWYPAKEGMEMDIKVVKMVYDEYRSKGVDLLVDANNSYTLQDTMTFIKASKEFLCIGWRNLSKSKLMTEKNYAHGWTKMALKKRNMPTANGFGRTRMMLRLKWFGKVS